MLKTWKEVTCVCNYLDALYIQVHTNTCVNGTHLLFRFVPVSTVAVYVTMGEGVPGT
jgi:hypothetical protein